jgi:hypothetical protein
LSPKESELFFIFEATEISFFQRDEKVIQVLMMRGGMREREVNQIPNLGREGNSRKRWEMDSNAERKKGRCEGPCIACLRRFSIVRSFPWSKNQHKMFTLGIEGSKQISFQILEVGGL